MGRRAATVLVLLAAACSDDEPASNTGGPAPSPEYTADNVCARIAPRICAARRACCEGVGIGYVEEGCVDDFLARCEAGAAAVGAGAVEFDPTRVDACVEDLERLMARCVVPTGELAYELADNFAVCGFFRGDRREGDTCQLSIECRGPSGPGLAACGDDTDVCEEVRIGGAGDSCNATDLCGPGLYCGLDASCEPALSLGSPCDPGANPLSCGAAFYCHPEEDLCTDAKPGGEPCAGDIECLSLVCNTTSQCVAVLPLVDAQQCGG